MSDNNYSINNTIDMGRGTYYVNASAILMPRLMQRLLNDKNGSLQKVYSTGTLVKNIDEVISLFKNNGGKLISNLNDDYIFIWEDDSYALIDYRETKAISVSGYYIHSFPEEIITSIKSEEWITKSKLDTVFTVVQTSGLALQNMGKGSSPLIEENYLPNVIVDINSVIESFQKDPPNGRICILNGEPGTGKTHLIRSLLSKIDATFIIVPSNLVSALDKPDFIPLLLNTKRDYEKSIILIIEDGDMCITPRNGGNMSTVASLLNLSDGILGNMLDIKMIISTNAEITELDQAILRPGRLCKNIDVDALPYEQANKVYQRLQNSTEVKLEYKKTYTLAEVYSAHNNPDGFNLNLKIKNKPTIGFNVTPNNPDVLLNKG